MKTVEIVVDEEFRKLISNPSESELSLLEENLRLNGCLDPLKVWEGHDILLDGHNRHGICERLNIPYEITYIELPNRHAAMAWIAANQLGRRNLTEMARAYLIGKQYEQRKLAQGGTGANQHTVQRDHTDPLADTDDAESQKTAEVIATENGVGQMTVKRNESFSSAVDTLTETLGPEFKDRVLAEEIGNKTDVKALAEKPEDEQRDIIELIDGEDVKTIGQAIRAHERATAAAEAETMLPPDDDFNVRDGDFREVAKSIEDESVDLIFTDPPYDRKTLPLYGDMAEVANRVLKPGGSMICYLGQFQIHEVCKLVTPHMRLWWTLACVHTGQSARMNEYGVVVKWKPMLWFVKGTRGDKQTFVDDAIFSEREKDTHEWQQGVIEARYYIEKLTKPGGFVFDPFCGGGTTAVASKITKRRWLTCDVNADSATLARQRIMVAA